MNEPVPVDVPTKAKSEKPEWTEDDPWWQKILARRKNGTHEACRLGVVRA